MTLERMAQRRGRYDVRTVRGWSRDVHSVTRSGGGRLLRLHDPDSVAEATPTPGWVDNLNKAVGEISERLELAFQLGRLESSFDELAARVNAIESRLDGRQEEEAQVPRGTATELLGRLVALAENEVFEDGIESEFSRFLLGLINSRPRETLNALSDAISSQEIKPEVAAESLRWVGTIDHPRSRVQRRELLEMALGSSSSVVRDGAVLGLSFLEDPSAVDPLLDAAERESSSALREDMLTLATWLSKRR